MKKTDCPTPFASSPLGTYLLALKLIVVLVLFGTSPSFASNAYAQETKISLSLDNTPLAQVFDAIEQKTEFYFLYNHALVNTQRRVSIHVKDYTIFQILDLLLGRERLDFEIQQKQIVIVPRQQPQVVAPKADGIVVSGSVTSDMGESLPGVSVVIQGTTVGTLTDFDGNFSIEVPNEQSVLVFSFIGYRTEEVLVGSQTKLKVELASEVVNIDEVVVVGFGTSSKKLLTGSVENVNAKELQETATYSLEGALNGKASGLQILQNSGTPGSAISVKIRGTSSIYSGTQPLYVIDGVPMTTGNYSQIGYGGQGIDASTDINPNNIESITVLKDASAAAIYGARAANGVILITTKTGKAGKTKVSFRSYYGMQKEWKRLDLMDAEQWRSYVSTFNPTFLEKLDPAVNTDWQDEVFRLAPMSNNEISLSGGSDKTRFYLSTGYLDQSGIIVGTGYRKFSMQANIDQKINDKLSVSLKNGLNNAFNDRVRGDEEIDGVLPNAISMPPVYPVRDALGNYSENGYFSNPVATANESTTRANTLRNISSLEVSYRPIPELSLRNQWGVDYYNLHERRVEPTTTRIGAESNGLIIEGRSGITKLTQQLLANYTKEVATGHHLDVLLGYSFELVQMRFSYTYGTNFPSVYPKYLSSAGNIETATTDATDEAINSYFGRVKYNINDRYLFEASVRADGSSKFGSNNRYATLPAGSFAWRIIEEGFMQNQSLFSDLKLKVGYGLTGNDKIGNNRYQNLYITGRNYYSKPGLAPKQIPNPDLRWETTTNFNVGLDIELWKGRFGLSTEYYQNLTNDLLLPRPLPGSSGFSSYTTNVGSISNTGYEFTLNGVLIDRALRWTSTLNISFNRNKVLELFNDQPIYSSSRGDNAVIVGQPLGVFFMYESKGVDPSTGDLVLTDLDQNRIFDERDKFVVGDPNPDFTGGFTNIFTYGNFDLRMFAQFTYGNDIYNGTRRYLENNAYGESDNQLATVLDQWRQVGDRTQIPRFGGLYNNRQSTRYLEDGSFVRLKEVTLGYNFSKAWLERHPYLSSVRLYAKAQNLLTLTNYTGLDPEVNYDGEGYELGMGTDFFTFPHPRVWLLGLNIEF